jgi:hypothetical protein
LNQPATVVAAAGGRRPRHAGFGRTLGLLAGGALCLLLGGCIYLRLLELRNQLADFDRYFSTDLRHGVTIICRQPVLLDQDMAFFRLTPASRTRIGVAERWHFRWVKNPPSPGEDPAQHEISADFIFVDHKLTRVILPPRLFAFVPKGFFLQMVRAFGHARLDRATRTASAQVHTAYGPGDEPPRLTRGSLTALLGTPTTVARQPDAVLWRYRYRAASPDQHSGYIDVTFTLDPATGVVRRVEGVVFNGRIDLDFAGPPAHAAAGNALPSHAERP